jgi:hypothetical protein
MVFGTWTTRRAPFDSFASENALNAVSSPPIVMSLPTPRASSAESVFLRYSGFFVGFAREVPSVEPPRKWMRLVSVMVSGVTCVVSPCMIHLKPSWMPRTSTPERHARIVAAPMTLLIPGAGPPATRIASLSLLTGAG